MNNVSLSQLRKDASKAKPESQQELVKIGRSRWYVGCLIDVPDKLVGLKTASGIEIRIAEEDIQEIREKDGSYLVRVDEGTKIASTFQVSGLAGSEPGCSCTEKEDSESELQTQALKIPDSRVPGDLFDPPLLGIYFCYREPELTERCFIIRDRCGNLMRVCIPYWTFRRVCRWI